MPYPRAIAAAKIGMNANTTTSIQRKRRAEASAPGVGRKEASFFSALRQRM